MEYHLHRNGKDEGIFTLEDLLRRREAGELFGTELVWRDGMASWEPLDSVLAAAGFNPSPAPHSAMAASPRARKRWVYIIAAAAALVTAGFVYLGIRAVQALTKVRQTVYEAADAPLQAATKPVTSGSNTLTQKDILNRSREFRVRQYVEGYQKNAPHDRACDAEAKTLMQSWIEYNYGPRNTNAPSPDLLADKLAAQPGCDDPLLLTATAALCTEAHEKTRRLQRARAGFGRSRHKAYPKLFVAVSLATELSAQPDEVRALDKEAVQHFKACLSDGSILPSDQAEFGDILVIGWGSAFLERNGAELYAIARQARNYPWLARMLEGQFHIKEAWKARGGGYADTVTTQGWQGFADHLAQARAALTEAWKLQPNYPLAPAQMVTVAMGEAGATDMRTWFDRAISAQIDHPQAWAHIRWGLRPRWHGSHDAMLALGFTAVETKRFDTDVPRKLFDFISDVESELELAHGEHIYGRQDIWPYLETLYEGYLAEPSERDHRDGWRSTYSAIAFLAGKYDIARQQLEQLQWKPIPRNLIGYRADLSLMPLEVAAITGPSASLVAKANARFAANDLGPAEKLYAEIIADPQADQRTRQFCQARSAALQQEQLLAKGQWIDLLPASQTDDNWVFWESKVRKLPDGAIEVSSDKEGHLFYPRTRIGREFEVTGEFEAVSSSNDDFQAGLVFGLPDSTSSTWYGFRMKRNDTEGQIVSFSRQWSRQQSWKKVALNDRTNSFRFRLQADKADAWLNGTQVLSQATPSKSLTKLGLHTDCLVGLGAYNDMNETVVRYRNVKLRRLSPER